VKKVLEMGQNEFGPHTTKETGLSGLLGKKHVEALVSNVKTVEHVLSLIVYSRRTPLHRRSNGEQRWRSLVLRRGHTGTW
jgi:hypothetical protein